PAELDLPAGGVLFVLEDEPSWLGTFRVSDVDDVFLRVSVSANFGRVQIDGIDESSMLVVTTSDETQTASGSSVTLEGAAEAVGIALEGLTYTSALNWNSVVFDRDTVEVEAWDYSPMSSLQGGHAAFNFHVHVTPGNDAPSIQGPSGNAWVGKEDSKILLSYHGGLVLHDPDSTILEGDLMEVKIAVRVGMLQLPLSQAAGLYLLGGDASDGLPEFWARGGLAELNRALLGLAYRAPDEWSGLDELDVWVSDLGDQRGAGALESTASYSIIVEAVADAPKLWFPRTVHYLDEDTRLEVSFIAVSDTDPGSVLTVEILPDNGNIEIRPELSVEDTWRGIAYFSDVSEEIGGKGQQGGLTLRGTSEDVQAAVRTLAYSPSANFAGQVVISLRVTDETGLSTEDETYLYVRPINDPPVIALQTGEDGGISMLQMAAGGAGDPITGVTITDVDVADSDSLCGNFVGVEARNALSLRLSSEFGSISIVAERAIGVRVVDESTAGPGEVLFLQGSVTSLQEAISGRLVLYSTAADFAGRDTVEVAVEDGGNCGAGGKKSVSSVIEVDVAPYEPPLAVAFDASARAVESALFTLEGEPLVLPDLVVTGGSVGERLAVEVVILAKSGNVSLQQPNMGSIEILDGGQLTGERLHIRGSPEALTAVLTGLSFEPRPHFFGCWDRNMSFFDDTPVRFGRLDGSLALARVYVVAAPAGAGGGIVWDGSSVKPHRSRSIDNLKISVGWVNDAPTVDAPEAVVVSGGLVESSPVSGIRVSDPDALEAPEGRGRVDVNVSTAMGSRLAVDATIALKNGLRDIGPSEDHVRLRGPPDNINNVLATLTILQFNATANATSPSPGDWVDDIWVSVSDLGFSGSGGEKTATASIAVEAGLPTLRSRFENDVFALETMLPLVSTTEGTAVALPGLEAALSRSHELDQLAVIVSAKEGYLSLGPSSLGVAEAAAKEDWGSAAVVVNILGGAEQTLPEIQVVRTLVPWRYEVQQLDVVARTDLATAEVYLSIQELGNDKDIGSDSNGTSTVGASLLDPVASAEDLAAALNSLPSAGKVSVERVPSISIEDPSIASRHLVTFLSRGGDVPILSVENWTVTESDASNNTIPADSKSSIGIKITELVAGSLLSEVQRVTLRVDAAVNGTGTFRLEAGDASEGGGGKSRVTADHDSRYWTSQLGVHSSAVEVAQALGHLPDIGYVHVLKTADGINRTYQVPAKESSTSNSSWTNATTETYSAWEWEITFATRAGDLPLMAAVWSDGRTSPAQKDGFELTGRSTRMTCGSCEAFPSGSWPATAEAVVGHRMEVTEVIAGSNPLSGFFSLVHAGHSFQAKAQTGPISVHASAGIVAAELARLETLGEQRILVSRSLPSAEGELAWTVTFARGEGDFPPMEAVVDEVTGTDAGVRVTTLANGVAPVRGSLSLVVSGVRGETPQATAPLPHDSSVDTITSALSALQPVQSVGVLVEVVRNGPFAGGGHSWSIAFKSPNSSATGNEFPDFTNFPTVGVLQANITGTGGRVQVERREAHETPAAEHVVSLAAPLSAETPEEQLIGCSLSGATLSEAELAGVSFVLTFRGETTEEMAPGTIINPDGLPACGELASGPCRGDGTTLKERLEALPTVGTINVTGISNANEAVGDDVGICGVNGVLVTFHDTFMNAGDLPLMSASSSNITLVQVGVVESVKGSAPFVNEVHRISLITNGTSSPAGTFSIIVGRDQTSPLAFNVGESDLAFALEQLPSIRGGIRADKNTAGDFSIWTVTFMSPGPQSLLQSACEETAVANSISPDCSLENARVKIRRVVRGRSPASGSFRLRLLQADDSTGSTSVTEARTSAPLPFDATAGEVHAAVVGLAGGGKVSVTMDLSARAPYGFDWVLKLHDNGVSSVELVDVIIDDPGPWCTDGVTGPAAVNTPCEFPFMLDEDGHDTHFACAGAVGSSPGWCSTTATFKEGETWGGCMRCTEISPLPPPTIHVAPIRRSFRLSGVASRVSRALSETVYHPRAFWNAWLGGHDEVSAYWYDENSLEGGEPLSGAKARSISQVFVAPVNNPPTVSIEKAARVIYEGEELLLEDAVVLDADLVERPQVPVRIELEAELGTLAFEDTFGLTFISGSPEPHSSQRLVLTGPFSAVKNAMQQFYYRPLPLSPGMVAALYTTLEVQRVEVTAPIVPMVQLITTSTSAGYIDGNFTLSLNCSAFLKDVDDLFGGVDLINQTSVDTSTDVVRSSSLVANVLATGDGSMETSVRGLLADCVGLARDRAELLWELSNMTSTGNSSTAENLTDDMLPNGGATAVVSSGGADLRGGFTWVITLVDVPPTFPAFEVGSNNLTGEGRGPEGSPYVFDGNPSKLPSITVDVAQAPSFPTGPTGTFTLAASPGGAATAPISTSASGDILAAALASLADVGAVQVSAGPIVTSSPATPMLGQYWEITFLQTGSPFQVGDLPLLEANGTGLEGMGTVLRVSEITKGHASSDSVTLVVNDLGNVGEGGALEATAAWNISIVPQHVPLVVRQTDDGATDPGDFLRTFEGSSVQLPVVRVSHYSAFEVAEDGPSNDLLYKVRLKCSRGAVKPASSAVGFDLAVTFSSTTITILDGTLPDVNRALSNLGYYAPQRYRGVDDVEIAARVAGWGFDVAWGTTKLYVFVDGVNDAPELSAPRSFTSKGAVPTLVGGISVSDDDMGGIGTITIEAARGLVSFPSPNRL
ncbi:unnamed protein product, partial [Hapterophycus canaliculatus]